MANNNYEGTWLYGLYPPMPGEGYVPQSTKKTTTSPSTQDCFKWVKNEAITDADKAQITTNKENIEALQTLIGKAWIYKGIVTGVEELPAEASQCWVYAVTNADTFYINISATTTPNWVPLVDLSGKQDALTPGTGITIENNVISATGGGGGGSISVDKGLEIGVPSGKVSVKLGSPNYMGFDANKGLKVNHVNKAYGTYVINFKDTTTEFQSIHGLKLEIPSVIKTDVIHPVASSLTTRGDIANWFKTYIFPNANEVPNEAAQTDTIVFAENTYGGIIGIAKIDYLIDNINNIEEVSINYYNFTAATIQSTATYRVGDTTACSDIFYIGAYPQVEIEV